MSSFHNSDNSVRTSQKNPSVELNQLKKNVLEEKID